jgi:hypothetical protein
MAVTTYTICLLLLATVEVGNSAHLRTLRQRRYHGSNPPYDRSGHPAEVDIVKDRDFSKTVTDFDRDLLTPTNKSLLTANTSVPKIKTAASSLRFAKIRASSAALRPRFALPPHPDKNDKLNTLVALLQQLVIENDKLSGDAQKVCQQEKDATGIWIDEGHGIEVADLAASHSSLSTALKPRIDDLKVFLGKLKIMQQRLKEHIDRVNIIYGKSIDMDSQDTIHFPNILHQMALEEADIYSPNSNPIRLPEGHTFLLEVFSREGEAGETGVEEEDTDAEKAAKADLGGTGASGESGSSGSTGSDSGGDNDDDFQSAASEEYKVLSVMKEKEENKIRESLGVQALTAGTGASGATGLTGASGSSGSTGATGGITNETVAAMRGKSGAPLSDSEVVDGPMADEEDLKDTPTEEHARFLSGVVSSKSVRSRVRAALKRHNNLISLIEAQSTVIEDPIRVETNPPSQEASADILQLYRIAVEDEKKQEKAFAAEKAELAAIRVGLENLINSRSEQLDQLSSQLLELERSEGSADLTVAGLWPKLQEHLNIITNACDHMRTSRSASRKQELLLVTQLREASVTNGFPIDNITLPVEEPVSDAPIASTGAQGSTGAAGEAALNAETDDADIPQTTETTEASSNSTGRPASPVAGVGPDPVANVPLVDEIIHRDGAAGEVEEGEEAEQPVVQVL